MLSHVSSMKLLKYRELLMELEKRAKDKKEYGFSLKFSYHLVRLLNECEQILVEGDLDLERSREMLKSIRKGEWSFDQIVEYFDQKKRILEELYQKSKIQYSPDESVIKNLLLNVLEHHYGSLTGIIERPNTVNSIVSDLEKVLVKYRGY